MKTEQISLTPENSLARAFALASPLRGAQLVLVFGDPAALTDDLHSAVSGRYPGARVVYCSSGGEFSDTEVLDERTAVITALHFESSRIDARSVSLPSADASAEVGGSLARSFATEGLRHVLVFAEGLSVNGSALARGLAAGLPGDIGVTGGLAADGDRFIRTVVGLDQPPTEKTVVAVALYGDDLAIGMGSLGGWQIAGRSMKITRSDGNVLYELDGRAALDVYKSFLGPRAYALPASGLMFPLNVREHEDGAGVVRTLLAIDEEARSVTFAGDVPEGHYARFMKADLDTLISAAHSAADITRGSLSGTPPELALLVSCIGRKLVLQKRAVDELRSARSVFGSEATITGFYSYGEISPLTPSVKCELHNQTMTITTISESDSRGERGNGSMARGSHPKSRVEDS
jgi:hypothetical protein